MCVNKQDERAAAEAKAQAVIDEDYKKLGPLRYTHTHSHTHTQTHRTRHTHTLTLTHTHSQTA